ncbi:MAG: GNAT family N-acetyltransferase, partial [Gammaproteobacteria bacterium]|nr:GNAT family N-acetyltransferase [Gammaproteobacteria bacterium]
MIREIQIEDIPQLIELGREMHAEGAYQQLDYSSAKTEIMFHKCLTLPDHLCLVAEKGDNIVGGILASLSTFWFGYDLIAEERVLFVTAEERKGTLGLKLVRGFEKWALESGAKEILTGTNVGIMTEKVRQFYEALGYET